MNILIVEDDNFNANIIEKLLKKEGFEVNVAENFQDAIACIDKSFYNLIILDWNLPDKSGYEFLEELRDLLIDSQVLMLSANDDVEYRVKALNGGADDYLCKPYSHVELLARVNSLLRRTNSNKNPVIQIGNVFIDKNAKEVRLDDECINLTPAEYDILEALASNQKKTFTKFDLLNIIHNDYASSAISNVIEVHIKNIRRKLQDKEIIKTVRSVGYKIVV
ncbi:response regulator transcription factor [bacterium]|nr:response regulator transcription factor [bacterium]MBU1884542.1 response regulator transcription factor [bacterium]